MENNNKTDHDITEVVPQQPVVNENGFMTVINHSRIRPPFSVVCTTVLYCAEFICAAVLCSLYHKTDDVVWMGLSITFMLVPSVLTQLTLTFVHRDLGKDRPLVLFMHLLQMGPIIRYDSDDHMLIAGWSHDQNIDKQLQFDMACVCVRLLHCGCWCSCWCWCSYSTIFTIQNGEIG